MPPTIGAPRGLGDDAQTGPTETSTIPNMATTRVWAKLTISARGGASPGLPDSRTASVRCRSHRRSLAALRPCPYCWRRAVETIPAAGPLRATETCPERVSPTSPLLIACPDTALPTTRLSFCTRLCPRIWTNSRPAKPRRFHYNLCDGGETTPFAALWFCKKRAGVPG